MGKGIITRRGLDTSDATATATDILPGKTAYSQGNKITGNSAAVLTTGATATAADIAADKTAYVNGVKITGNFLESEDDIEMVDFSGYTLIDGNFRTNGTFQSVSWGTGTFLFFAANNNDTAQGFGLVLNGAYLNLSMQARETKVFKISGAITQAAAPNAMSIVVFRK